MADERYHADYPRREERRLLWRAAVGIIFAASLVLPRLATAQDASWRVDPPLPYTPAFHQSIAVAGRLTVLGGEIGSGPVADTYWTTVGTPDRWTAGESLPQPLAHAAFVYSGPWALLIGGWSGRSVQRIVYQATIDANGSVRGWQSMPDLLPEPRRGAAAVVRSGTVYLIGGEDDAGRPAATVYSAAFGTTGIGGPWRLAGMLPEPLEDLAAFEIAGSLVLHGGRNGASRSTGLVSAPSVEPGWERRNPLPAARAQSAFAASTDRLVLAGGIDAAILDTVVAAKILTGGSLAPWTVLPNLPQPLTGASMALSDGAIVVTGGNNGTRYLNSVYRYVLDARSVPPASNVPPEAPFDIATFSLETTPLVPIFAGIAGGSLFVAVVLLIRERLTKPKP